MNAATDEAVQLLSDLVAIESVTPWLVPGGAGEGAIVAYMASYLEHLGVGVEVDEIEPGRFNLLATVLGERGGPTLCLNAHSDTVGYDNWRSDALHPRLQGDCLYGLGAVDDKAGCAAILLALKSLAANPPHSGAVLAAFVADEEALSIGTQKLAQHGDIDAAIVIEPVGLDKVIVAHQGFGWVDIVTQGVAAHGSAPEEGVDSIAHMAQVIVGLQALARNVFKPTTGSQCGRTVFHTGKISGGTDYATYPSVTTLGIEIGTQPGEHLASRIAEINAIFADISDTDPTFRGKVAIRLEREPFVAAGHEALLKALNVASEQVRGVVPTQVGFNGWADPALLQSAGIPTVLIGPAGGNIHAPREWASIPELMQFSAILETTTRTFLA